MRLDAKGGREGRLVCEAEGGRERSEEEIRACGVEAKRKKIDELENGL